MYSVTVAKYPHWVDLDAGEVKNIKGFIYLPRQDGNNGKIKDYSIQVSMDGKNWGTPVQKGTFDNSSKEKQVEFPNRCKPLYPFHSFKRTERSGLCLRCRNNDSGRIKTGFIDNN